MTRSTITSNMRPSTSRLPITATGMIHTRGLNSPPPPLHSTYREQHLNVTYFFLVYRYTLMLLQGSYIITPRPHSSVLIIYVFR